MSKTGGHDVSDLVRRARRQGAPISEQHAAFTVLVKRFEEMAFATALQSCDDVESARDACQEASSRGADFPTCASPPRSEAG